MAHKALSYVVINKFSACTWETSFLYGVIKIYMLCTSLLHKDVVFLCRSWGARFGLFLANFLLLCDHNKTGLHGLMGDITTKWDYYVNIYIITCSSPNLLCSYLTIIIISKKIIYLSFSCVTLIHVGSYRSSTFYSQVSKK